MRLLYWISAFVLAYTFVGYPILIGFLAKLLPKHSPIPRGTSSPAPLSIVLVVFNGKEQIRSRLENLLAQDYPIHEVLVICDGCTDGTPEEVATLLDSRIILVPNAVRSGKSACLNLGLQLAIGEIVVLTDVRQQFQPDTISRLIDNFSDPQIGAVSGALEIKASSHAIGKGVDAYWNFEKSLRHAESAFDSCIGCTGAVYALRRSLFQPIPQDTFLDDVVIPMQIAAAGSRVVFEPRAIAYDPQTLHPARESVRKRRTLAGNFQMLFRYPGWMLPWRNRLCVQLVSHKYLRLSAPFFLLTILGANFLLLDQIFYRLLLLPQIGLYLFGVLGGFPFFKKIRLFSLPASFLFLNLMVVRGLLDYLFVNRGGLWESPSHCEQEETSQNPSFRA